MNNEDEEESEIQLIEEKQDEEVKEQNVDKLDKVVYGKRILVDQFIHYDFKYLCENTKK